MGIALVLEGVMSLRGETAIGGAILRALGSGAGILLLAGLWTPIAGTVVTLLELWSVFSEAGDLRIHILLGTGRLVRRCPPFWMEAHRHSGWKELSLLLLLS